MLPLKPWAKWLKREVETQLEKIRKATKGTRQKTTYGATIVLAKFIPNGYLTEDYVREEVWKAVRENKTYKEDDHAERHSTIENGLTRGQSEHEEPVKLLTNEELHQPITAEYKFNNETYYYETTLSELVSVIDNLDLGDGELLKALFSDKIRLFREQNDGNGWLIYNGQHWKKSFIEIGKTLASAARSIIMPHWDKIKTEISITQDKAWSRLEAKKTNGGFDNAKKSYRELISDSPTDYDTNHYYLNCCNGTFDLQSMKLISHRPEHQQMKCLPWEYDASAKCPKWRAFFNDVYEDNQEVIHFIQQFAGISLTGEITEHFCFFWGNGSNGKSTILMTLMDLLGDYGQMLDSKIFTGEADNASRERVKLLGARLAVAMEIRNNAQYNTQVLKSLSSQDKIVGEAKYQHPITFQPSHKLWIMGNHKPSVSDNSEGLARRLVYVPHNWRIPDAKVMAPFLVKEMFRKEMPGILNWSIDGWKDYCQRGRLLLIPEYLKEESKRYLEENTIQPAAVEFLLECDHIMFEKGNPNYIAQAKPLYETYVKWHNAYKKGSPITLTKFGDQLKTYGLVKYRTGKGNYYVGVMNHQDNEFNFSSEAKRAIRSNETTN